MNTINKLTIDEWDKNYKPITNKFDKDASFNGVMFETYGKELDYVLTHKNNKIWTLIDTSEGDIAIINGYHLVNRIGYFITKSVWVEDYITVEVK